MTAFFVFTKCHLYFPFSKLFVTFQVGFTLPALRGRSCRYVTDLAKAISVPVIHVNGDHPEVRSQYCNKINVRAMCRAFSFAKYKFFEIFQLIQFIESIFLGGIKGF